MASKREGVGLPYAADQIGLLAVVLPGFALDFRRVQYTGWNGSEPNFVYQEQGCCWLVAESDGALAGEYLWQLLSTPGIFAD
jgi:hypothetical protein